MKQPNEKKQDLLLDALSCIDEDILERGLALRDGAAAPAPKAAESAPKTSRPATVIPPLYDLTRQPDKPPKKNPWRVISVVAAACLLLCVVPLSMWMVGSMSKNETAAPDEYENNGTSGNIKDSNAEGIHPDSSPVEEEPDLTAPSDGTYLPDEEPTEAATKYPFEEATKDPYDDYIEDVTEPSTEFFPHEMVWEPTPDGDGITDYTAQAHNGTHVELIAPGISESAEDERALLMVSQWLLSLYTLDYGDHFPLFYESFVQEKFIKEAVDYGRDYTNAIDRIDSVAANLFPVDSVILQLSLEENTLLAGEELEAYIATKPAYQTSRGFDPEWITAVRRVRVSGGVEIDGFHPDTTDIWEETFYLYEYEGEWYLDETFMDDDLSLDLLGTGTADKGFYKMKTTEGRVVAVDDIYLYLDTGHAFRIDSARIQIQTDNGEWHDVEIHVGDIVSVSHYSFELEGLTRSVDGTDNDVWTLATADRVKIIG